MKLIYALILATIMISCNSNPESTSTQSDTNATIGQGVHHVKALEVIQTSSYSYILVSENNQEFWIAVSLMDIEIGAEYYYSNPLEMRDFQSKELNRVFDQVFFVQNISNNPTAVQPTAAHSTTQNPMPQKSKSKPSIKEEALEIEAAEGGITIGELFENSAQYENKKVIVKGKVMKVNTNIMKRNWIHIQDGTGSSDNYDLTLTSHEQVNVGDIITFEGIVALNKDFGGGYIYDLIIEEAIVK